MQPTRAPFAPQSPAAHALPPCPDAAEATPRPAACAQTVAGPAPGQRPPSAAGSFSTVSLYSTAGTFVTGPYSRSSAWLDNRSSTWLGADESSWGDDAPNSAIPWHRPLTPLPRAARPAVPPVPPVPRAHREAGWHPLLDTPRPGWPSAPATPQPPATPAEDPQEAALLARLGEEGGVWPELIRQLNQPNARRPLAIYPGTVARWQRLRSARRQPGFDGQAQQQQGEQALEQKLAEHKRHF